MYCTYCAATLSDQLEICPTCGVRNFTVHNHCHNCGSDTNAIQEMCTTCGIILKNTRKSTENFHPMIPTLLTLLIPGVGQIINKQVGKGFLLLIIFALSVFIPFGIGLVIVGLLIIIDAYLVGKKHYEGKLVGKWQFF
ncbi:hypothetical protein [Lysinibacillus sphaericus]|uniref:DZANK-type domain-containing protein n=1 Tax=Lysinibacillus sphaericus OT4b.31 TaxID=1285586 RepID=R7ZE65_LYSSH|nr:hypothetical protein [Lysinibacillus sphaericus]EON72425.1 hypothetical protein H131_09808 [Lysinibacillus sphaericus OT4b.31]